MAEYGRELYTAPFIYIPIKNPKTGAEYWELTTNDKGKPATKTKFKVEKIVIENKKITKLAIINNKNIRVYGYEEKKEESK